WSREAQLLVATFLYNLEVRGWPGLNQPPQPPTNQPPPQPQSTQPRSPSLHPASPTQSIHEDEYMDEYINYAGEAWDLAEDNNNPLHETIREAIQTARDIHGSEQEESIHGSDESSNATRVNSPTQEGAIIIDIYGSDSGDSGFSR